VRGSENPNLMPENSVTVRFHSVGGWGMITTGKNMAMTLFDLLGYHIKANPKYGSEKKGQPKLQQDAAGDIEARRRRRNTLRKKVRALIFHMIVVLKANIFLTFRLGGNQQHTNYVVLMIRVIYILVSVAPRPLPASCCSA